jgi:hypothetical protein
MHSKSLPKHMRSLAIKIRENSMIKVVLRPFNKEQLVEATVTFSPKCSVEVVDANNNEVHKKVKMFNMPLKLLLKKFSKARLPKLLLIETESVLNAMVKEDKAELMQHVQVAEEEV